jgi:hypothetical protein
MPVDVIGITGKGPAQSRQQTPKREILSNCAFALCPENRLYPGYITEKIPEALASGSYPLGWYLNGLNRSFDQDGHLNIAELEAHGISADGSLAKSIDERYIHLCKEGSPPLIDQVPSLEPIIELLERAVLDCH